MRPAPAWLFLPVAALPAAAFATGLGLCLATGAAFYTDVIDTYQIVPAIWMYLTPVLYPGQRFADALGVAAAGQPNGICGGPPVRCK